MIYQALFYGSPIALLIACLFILWLVWANQRLRAIVLELEVNGANLYEAGTVHGWAQATEMHKQSRPYQDGYTAGERAGFVRASIEQLGIASEMDVVRQSGELQER